MLSTLVLCLVGVSLFADGPRSEFIFASWVRPGPLEADSLMFVRSLRKFGGEHARSSVWVYVPKAEQNQLSSEFRKGLADAKAELIPFQIDKPALDFSYAGKTVAAGLAEERATGKANHLVFVDPDTLVLRSPDGLRLPQAVGIGCRPVFFPNIGAPTDKPLDSFWTRLLKDAKVAEERLKTVPTAVAGVPLRGYINAGLIVVRPDDGHLRAWRDEFLRLYNKHEYAEFYKETKYRVFMHQAVLSAVIAKRLDPNTVQVLPNSLGYSIAYQDQYIVANKHATVDALVTLRTEGFFDKDDWEKRIPAGPALTDWIIAERKAAQTHKGMSESVK